MGSNGEFSSMTQQEKVQLLTTIKVRAVIDDILEVDTDRIQEEASADKILIAGTGSTSIQETIDLSKAAKQIGYDAVMIITPYYFVSKVRPVAKNFHRIFSPWLQMNDAALEEYYLKIANSVDIPVILYNMPGYSVLVIKKGIVCYI